MAFKGEIQVGALNTLVDTKGITANDFYYINGSGNLHPNNLPVKTGNFVGWIDSKWKLLDVRYALTAEVKELAAPVASEVLYKKGSAGSSIKYAEGYEVGKYYQLEKDSTTIWQCTAIDDEGSDPRLIYFQKVDGLLTILNNIKEVPVFSNSDAGKVLTVNDSGTEVEWDNMSGGSTKTTLYYVRTNSELRTDRSDPNTRLTGAQVFALLAAGDVEVELQLSDFEDPLNGGTIYDSTGKIIYLKLNGKSTDWCQFIGHYNFDYNGYLCYMMFFSLEMRGAETDSAHESTTYLESPYN